MELRDYRPGLLRLLVRVCAVVGGAFAVTGAWGGGARATTPPATVRRGMGMPTPVHLP